MIEKLEAEAGEHPLDEEGKDEAPERQKLKRELQAEALARLEDAARTPKDFEAVTAWWDRLDANRERRERYHELSRSGDDLPLEYGASDGNLYFPNTLNDAIERQIRKVRTTMLKRIRKKLLAALSEKVNKQQPLTLLEKEFLKDNGSEADKSINGRKKK